MLISHYGKASPDIRRELILAAGVAKQGSWLKERKDEFLNSSQWVRAALIASSPNLPGDEAKFWLSTMRWKMTAMEKLIARLVFKDKSLKLGEINIR